MKLTSATISEAVKEAVAPRTLTHVVVRLLERIPISSSSIHLGHSSGLLVDVLQTNGQIVFPIRRGRCDSQP